MKVIMPLAILGVVVGGAVLFMNASPHTDSDSSKESVGTNSIEQEQYASVTPTAPTQTATVPADNSSTASTPDDRWDTAAGLEAVKS